MAHRVLILGGDGYLGWATAMYLSERGHEICVVDNYLRRRMSREKNVEPLIDPPNLQQRAAIWEELTGKRIQVHIADCTDAEAVRRIVGEFQPTSVVHYAEQPSAPYSMADYQAAGQTVQNNLMATVNIVFAVRDLAPDAHIVKLGTMGEYGTPNIDIEEGYLSVTHKGRDHTFLYPKTPGSIYHLTKVQDSDLMYFATRIWDMAITDLNQGPVYGINTEESKRDERLAPIFNYDDIFGTVLNRFAVQAVAGFPLTVYGKGGQVRGYLNILDTMQCIELAVTKPAKAGEFRVMNQFVETFSVLELAEHVRKAGEKMGLDVKVESIENPRREMEEHYYNPANTNLLNLGLKPNPLTTDVLVGMLEFVSRHKDRIDHGKFLPKVKWKA